jgi:glutamate synthase domain-containing protein 3
MTVLDAERMNFKDLNIIIKNNLKSGENVIQLKNVAGQRYIGGGIQGKQKLIIQGIPGNDMAAYMDGPEVIVNGNAQDAMANTMNNGRIIVHGNAGDTAGYAMRGGEIFIKGNVGYRVGIHMKEYSDKKPVIVIGGKAGNFLGEYMAGGIIILLGLGIGQDEEIVGDYCGTGMHGGVIYMRGGIDPYKLGKEVRPAEPDEEDLKLIAGYVGRFSQYFGVDSETIMNSEFTKLFAYNKRPYGNLYAY